VQLAKGGASGYFYGLTGKSASRDTSQSPGPRDARAKSATWRRLKPGPTWDEKRPGTRIDNKKRAHAAQMERT